ncbi:hypothetical protein Taro_001133 [Colocasia esculenta]|uniref:Uncharacterized protein n=1 Tax=Colocasia esculenta TaxID=4460 RepID=A0A843TCQ2_COLES|nr:hypothetical protein [Colocasia esculenta]
MQNASGEEELRLGAISTSFGAQELLPMTPASKNKHFYAKVCRHTHQWCRHINTDSKEICVKMLRLCRHMSRVCRHKLKLFRFQPTQVDTLSEQVDTGSRSQNRLFEELGQQVDTLSEQVDTRPSSQNSQFEELGQQVDTLKSRSTRDSLPRTALLISGTVCRHYHQGRLCRHNPLSCRHTTPVKSTHPSSCVDTAFLPDPFQNSRVHLNSLLFLRGSVPLHPFFEHQVDPTAPFHSFPARFPPKFSLNRIKPSSPLHSSISSPNSTPIAPWSTSWVPAVAQDQRPLQGQFRQRFRASKRGRTSTSDRGDNVSNPSPVSPGHSFENPEESSSSSSESQPDIPSESVSAAKLILKPRILDLSDIQLADSLPEIQTYFSFQSWIPFISEFQVCYPRLVREFYKNLTCTDEGYESKVKGIAIDMPTAVAASIFKVPDEGADYHEFEFNLHEAYSILTGLPADESDPKQTYVTRFNAKGHPPHFDHNNYPSRWWEG